MIGNLAEHFDPSLVLNAAYANDFLCQHMHGSSKSAVFYKTYRKAAVVISWHADSCFPVAVTYRLQRSDECGTQHSWSHSAGVLHPHREYSQFCPP
jgi:hypothetical protein